MNQARKYYTLLVKYQMGDYFEIAFGDYDKVTVVMERERLNCWKTRIVCTNDDQASIDAARNELNESSDMPTTNVDLTKVEALAGQVRALSDAELVMLVCNLVGVTMQKINLSYHICVNDSMDMIEAGTFEDEAMKGSY